MGDLLMAVISVFVALYVWRQFSNHARMLEYLAIGIPQPRIDRLLDLQGPFYMQGPAWFFLLPLAWLLLLVELYEPHVAASGRKTTRGIIISALLGMAVYSLLFIVRADPTNLPRIGIGAFLVSASLLTLAWRMFFIRLYKRTGQMRRVLLIGAGKAGQTLAEIYRTLGIRSFNIVGYIDDDIDKVGKEFQGFPVLGTSENLLIYLDAYHISDIVVAINGEIGGKAFQAILDAQEKGVDVTRMPILYEEMTGRVPIHHLESDWIIRSFVDGLHVSGFYELFKRVMDIFGGIVGIFLFLLFLPFIAIAIVLDSGLPIFYSQSRLGRGGSLFRIYKFRSMYQKPEQVKQLQATVENDPRVTRVGNFLRKSRLDELPQFWNVLRGDMSLVGPRAEIPDLVAEYQKQIPFYRARLLVKPGLTGWAQINYGYVANVIETSIKLEYDLYYIKHRTLSMDFQIILRTITTVIKRTGR